MYCLWPLLHYRSCCIAGGKLTNLCPLWEEWAKFCSPTLFPSMPSLIPHSKLKSIAFRFLSYSPSCSLSIHLKHLPTVDTSHILHFLIFLCCFPQRGPNLPERIGSVGSILLNLKQQPTQNRHSKDVLVTLQIKFIIFIPVMLFTLRISLPHPHHEVV